MGYGEGITDRHDTALIVVNKGNLAFLGAPVRTAILDRALLRLALTALTCNRADNRY